jgi:hypothetical protein
MISGVIEQDFGAGVQDCDLLLLLSPRQLGGVGNEGSVAMASNVIVCAMLVGLAAGLWCCLYFIATDSGLNPWHEQHERNRKRRYW